LLHAMVRQRGFGPTFLAHTVRPVPRDRIFDAVEYLGLPNASDVPWEPSDARIPLQLFVGARRTSA
jgi:hypothetical protein